MNRVTILCLILFLLSRIIISQEKFAKTLFLEEGKKSPSAKILDVEWIEGHWIGKAFGGTVEEIWSPPFGGSMMCVFRLVVENKVKFYEIVTITETNESLILKLKHFNSDLTGWEEKEETVDFPLVKIEENIAYFDGFTFEKINPFEMNIYVVIENKSGVKSEAKFNYHRFIE